MKSILSYTEQLKTPEWKEKRAAILQRDRYRCRDCGSKEGVLHVHHKKYITGRMAWDYPDNMLQTLCDRCHKAKHASGKTKVIPDKRMKIKHKFANMTQSKVGDKKTYVKLEYNVPDSKFKEFAELVGKIKTLLTV